MIRTIPRSHQKDVVLFCKPLDYGAIIASYGTGKTLMALWLTEVMKWKLVIIVSTKSSLESTWEDEIKKHSDYRFARIDGNTPRQKINLIRMALNRQSKILLINFDGVRNILDAIAAIKSDAVIVDESLKISNPDALRTKVMWALGRIIPKRFIMAGNVFSEGLHQIYSQVKFLDNGKTFGNSYKQHLKDYFDKKKGKYVPKKGMTQKIFKLIKPFTIMVPASAVQLPPATFKKIGIHPTTQQEELLTNLKNDFKLELGKVHVNIDSIYALISKCQQICDGFITDKDGHISYIETPKDEALIDELEDIGRSEKIIIWSVFRAPIKKLYRILTKLGYGVLVLDGDTKDSGNLVKHFQNNPRYTILLSTLKKGNESLNLQGSRISLYYSRSWSYNERDNSLARNRRMGSLEKHDSIMYGDIFLKGTIEEQIYDCLVTKGNLVVKLKKYFK